MTKTILTAALAALAIPAAMVPTSAFAQDRVYGSGGRYDERAMQRNERQDGRGDNRDWREYRNYDHNNFEGGQNGYDASRYYRNGSYYQDRTLSNDDRVYRGQNNRYYCRRSDGTTGLIIGGLAGGALGSTLDLGGSGTLGTLLGGAGGALAGRSIQRNSVRCD